MASSRKEETNYISLLVCVHGSGGTTSMHAPSSRLPAQGCSRHSLSYNLKTFCRHAGNWKGDTLCITMSIVVHREPVIMLVHKAKKKETNIPVVVVAVGVVGSRWWW
jgi:hypothetical protein